MKWIPILVNGENGIINTLKENRKRGGKYSFWFTTFFGFNPYLGTDPEELRILVNASNKFQDLITLEDL